MVTKHKIFILASALFLCFLLTLVFAATFEKSVTSGNITQDWNNPFATNLDTNNSFYTVHGTLDWNKHPDNSWSSEFVWNKYDNSIELSNDYNGTNGRLPIGRYFPADMNYAYAPSVVKDGDTYHMWYSGYSAGIATRTIILYATSSDGNTWTKYDNTNIQSYTQALIKSDTNSPLGKITIGNTGKGDDASTSCPSVIKDGNLFRMWYNGSGAKTRIYYATSTNGIDWNKYNNTIPADTNTGESSTDGRLGTGGSGRGDSSASYCPTVVKVSSNDYRMWYSGSNGTNVRTFLATSTDGLTWTKVDNSAPTNSDTTGTNGRIPIGTVATRGDAVHAYLPEVIYDGNIFRMWYTGYGGTGVAFVGVKYRIFMATSPDGNIWTKVDNNVYVSTNLANSVSDSVTTNGRVWEGSTTRGDFGEISNAGVLQDGNTLRMYYSGSKVTGNPGYFIRIYSTRSDNNGSTWTKVDNTVPTDSDTTGTNGRIPLGVVVKGDIQNAVKPSVIKDGNLYKMWYGGYSPFHSYTRIYYAYSSDGLTWTKYDTNVPDVTDSLGTSTNGRLGVGTVGTGDVGGAFCPAVIKDGNLYRMWYGGYDGANSRIYYAYSSDGLSWTKLNNAVPADSDTTSTDGRIPLGTTGKGDLTSATCPSVVKTADGNYFMWYYGYTSAVTNSYRTYMATSTDGLTWTKVNNTIPTASNTIGTFGRIPIAATSTRADYTYQYGISVIQEDNNQFTAMYSGSGPVQIVLLAATSVDGYTWIKYDNTAPTVSNIQGTNWRVPTGVYTTTTVSDLNYLYYPQLLKEGTTYKLWYTGYQNITSVGSSYQISYATSTEQSFDNNLSLYLDFDRNYSTVIYDRDRNFYGTLTNGAYLSKGLFDTNSIYFDGLNDYFLYSTSGSSANQLLYDMNTNFTIMFWANPSVCALSGTTSYIVSRVNAYGIYMCSGGGPNLGYWLSRASGATLAGYGSGRDITSGGWHHIALVVNDQNALFYLDGNLLDNRSGYTWNATPPAAGTLQIGTYNATAAYSYAGYIDEFKFYQQPLTETQVFADYNAWLPAKFIDANIIDTETQSDFTAVKVNSLTPYKFGKSIQNNEPWYDSTLMALLHLDQNTTDASPTPKTVDWNSTTAAYTSGLWDSNSAIFNTSNYVRVQGIDSNIKALSIWINPADGNANLKYLLGTSGNSNPTIALGPFSAFFPQELITIYNQDATGGYTYTQANPDFNKWNHLVINWNGSSYDIWLNGTKRPTQLQTRHASMIDGSTITLGARTGSVANKYNGQIEEFAAWNTSLTDANIENMYRKGVSRLDLNVYSCSDSACNTKVSSEYLTQIDNNTSTTISSLTPARYFGYDAFFNYASGFENKPVGILGKTSFIQNITVTASIANLQPTGVLTTIEGVSISSSLPYFSNITDGNLDLNFTVYDQTDDRILATVSYGATNSATRGTVLVQDVNLDESNCSSTTWSSVAATCTISVPISNISDGNYYFKLDLNDNITPLSVVVTSQKIPLDNNGPIITRQNSASGYERNNVTVSLTCTDTQSGCDSSTIRYKIDGGAWNNYTTAFSLTGDGNRTITVDANDNEDNYSEEQSFIVQVGYNGLLHTFTDQNITESFFASGEIVRFIYSTQITSAPHITISDSTDTNIVTEAVMTSSPNDPLGINDLNIFIYDFTVSGETGWYDVIIENQEIDDIIYQGEVWDNNFYDADANLYPFSIDLNTTENSGVNRWFEPIDYNFSFTYKANPSSVRVLDFNTTHYLEIPSQVYSVVYDGQYATSTKLVFLSTVQANTTKKYYISYATLDADKNYTTDLSDSLSGTNYIFENSLYEIMLASSRGGTQSTFKSKIGTNDDMNSSTTIDDTPRIVYSEEAYLASTESTPTMSTILDGDLIKQIRVRGSIDYGLITLVDYNVLYTFYAKTPYYFVDTNVIARAPVTWDTYYDDYFSLDPDLFTQVSYFDTNITTINTAQNNTTTALTTISYIGAMDVNTLNGVALFLLDTNTSLSTTDELELRDSATTLGLRRKIIENETVSAGNLVITNNARSTFNPLVDANDLNNIFTQLIQPLTILTGTTLTNDLNDPVHVISGYSPADLNDEVDVNCYTSWTDDTIVDNILVNVLGPNLDYNTTYSVLEQSADVSHIIDANLLNGGSVTCTFYATDVADHTVTSSTTFNVVDGASPVIANILTSPDTNADIDTGDTITIDANIVEYTAMLSAVLNYRTKTNTSDSNWSDWALSTMTNDANFSDTNYSYTDTIIGSGSEEIIEFFITATDVNAHDTNSATQTIYLLTDYTWTRTPNTFGVVSDQISTTTSLGTINVENTGDVNLSFTITSNWENKNDLKFNLEPESSSGYSFTLIPGDDLDLTTTIKTKSVERSDSLTITIDATDSNSSPDTNTITATIVSVSDGPFLLLEWVDQDLAVTQGDTNVVFTVQLTNAGIGDANTINLDWNVPADWVITDGLDSTDYNELIVNDSVTNTITYTISSSAELGDQTVSLSATCCSIESKTQSISMTTEVVESDDGGSDSGGGDDTGGPGTGSGGSTGGGGGGSGGGAPFLPSQEDLFFQTSEFYELVRGEDSSFPVKVTNPLDFPLTDIKLSVSGLISTYLKLNESSVDIIDTNQEFVTSIDITSPKYFNPGTYELTFTIEGKFKDRYGRTIEFKEDRIINLLIHDTNVETAQKYISDMNVFINDLSLKNFKLGEIPDLLDDSIDKLEEHDYDGVTENYNNAKNIYETALEANEKSKNVSGLIGLSNDQGISTPNTDRLLALAKIAFERGDYALALSRLKEAELTYSLETKGEFNLFVWVLANPEKIILMAALLFLAGYMFVTGLSLLLVKRKLKDLNSENNLLLALIQDLQKRTFVENRIGMGEYYDALQQFENRIASVSEGIINFTSRKNNLLKFSSSVTRLSQEKRSLLDILRDTQSQYFNKGLVETRIYRTKVDSLTKRLSEVEEELVSNDLKKTVRVHSAGLIKYFWKAYYKVFK